MNAQKFTQKSLEAVQLAQDIALERGNMQIEPAHLLAALLAWLDVRSAEGELVLRIEDLDTQRTSGAFAQQLMEDLRWLGLDWDGAPVYQTRDGGASLGAHQPALDGRGGGRDLCLRQQHPNAALRRRLLRLDHDL